MKIRHPKTGLIRVSLVQPIKRLEKSVAVFEVKILLTDVNESFCYRYI